MSSVQPVSAGATPAATPQQAAGPQAPTSAETPTELAGAPGVENSAAEFAGEAQGGGGLQSLASALLLALLFGEQDGEDDKSSTAKLLLGLAALGMLAPQNGPSVSFHASFGANDAQQAYGQASGVAPTVGVNINATA